MKMYIMEFILSGGFKVAVGQGELAENTLKHNADNSLVYQTRGETITFGHVLLSMASLILGNSTKLYGTFLR